MNINNLKIIATSLIAVFAMAAVYEVVVSQNDYPLLFVYNSNEDNSINVSPCFVTQRCTCYIKVMPSSENYRGLLKVLSKNNHDFSTFYHTERLSLMAYHGDEQASRDEMLEYWYILETGNTSRHVNNKPRGRTNSFALNEKEMDAFRISLEKHATGINGTCSQGQIDYPHSSKRQKYDDEANEWIQRQYDWESKQLRKKIDKPDKPVLNQPSQRRTRVSIEFLRHSSA